MIKTICLLFLLILCSWAADVSATSQNIRSYPLPVDKASIKASYDEGITSTSINDSLEDLSGVNFALGFGFYEYLSLFYDFSYQNFDYAGEDLRNKRHELFAKLNIYNNPSTMFNTFSTDLGLVFNSASDLSISGSSLGITTMNDISDSSLYLRFLTGSKIRSSILDFYFGLKYTDINTKLDSISYDRNEVALNIGFQYTLELGNYLIETGYEYIRLFSRNVENVKNNNQIINLTLSYVINQELLLFIGGKLYSHQYNGVIPYMYNEKSKNEFDKSFGYATIGFVYNFNPEFYEEIQ